ncbi:MAG: DNA gyrase subunit A, partial [FCB group bacterium]|nr:DNA gyrase subunit A [FCB group bacterium]
TQTVESSRRALIITEIPFQVNKAKLIGNIAELVKDKTITGIADLRDESDRNGMRIVVELKNDANDLVILNQLYKHTQLLKTFGGNYLALVNGRPERLSIRQCLEYFINHRHDVVLRRTIYELNKAEARAHILEGLLKAIAIIDEIIAIIKASKRPDIAKTELIKRFAFTEIQAQAILDMRLRKLTGLEKEELKFEYDELMEIIVRLRILAEQRPERMKLIAEELREISEIFGQDRKTIIDPNAPDILELEDLIDDTDVIVTISKAGYIKRMALDVYKSQRRGGRGITGAKTREEDYLEQIFISSNLSYILFFTNRGKCHWLKVYEIPEVTRISTGKAIVNLLNLEEGETPVAHVCVKEFSEDRYILMATSNGLVKKTKLSAYSHPRTGGIWAIKLDEGTELIAATLTTGNWEVLLAMKNGKANRFSETEVRSMSRHTRGVKGIRIAENDALVDMLVMEEPVSILTISERGYGKRTHAEEYRLTHRGSGGVINIRNLERNGPVISAMAVEDDDELILISAAGMIIRLKVNEIRETRRSTMGVRIMKLPDNDRVVDAAIVRLDEDEDADEIIDDENNGSSK